MTVSSATATVRRDNTTTISKGMAGQLISFGARTVELAAAASACLIDFKLTVPSNMRIAGCSRIYWDDLATSGSPTLDLGCYNVNSNITDADHCINDGLAISAVSTAQAGNTVVKDIADYGKELWQIAGASSDPGGNIKIKGIVRDAATTQTGTITIDLYGYVD